MALLLGCGFDLFGNGTDSLMDGWTGSGGGGGATNDVQTTNGRSGGGCYRIQRGNGTGNNPISFLKIVGNQGTSAAHMYIGVAYNATSTSSNLILAVMDNGTIQCDVRHAGDGSLNITRNGTSLGTVGAGTLTFGSFHYFEIDVVVASGTSGSIKVIMDGTTLTNITGVNTQATANAFWNQIFMGGTSAQSVLVDYRYDDLYICDSSGSAPYNTNLGDIRVIGQVPTGIGTYSQMTKVGASATNWQSVDEKPTNGDTDYVSSSVVNTQDTYTYDDLPSNTNTVLAVLGRPNAKKDDAGLRSLVTHMRDSSGNEVDTPTSSSLSTSYAYYTQIAITNPVTGLAWTVNDVNNMEFGPKVAA